MIKGLYLAENQEDRYFDEVHKPFWKKYGRPRMITVKPTERGSVPVTIVYPRETASNRSTLIRKQRKLTKLEHQLRTKDLKRAFDLMLKNIWGWWD